MSQDQTTFIADLGAGLILRRSSPADAEALAAFCGEIHGGDPDESEAVIMGWTGDLLTRPYPRFRPDDFTIVEEA